jgi:hypothetical protein
VGFRASGAAAGLQMVPGGASYLSLVGKDGARNGRVAGEQMRGRDRMDRIRCQGYFGFSFNSLTSFTKK